MDPEQYLRNIQDLTLTTKMNSDDEGSPSSSESTVPAPIPLEWTTAAGGVAVRWIPVLEGVDKKEETISTGTKVSSSTAKASLEVSENPEVSAVKEMISKSQEEPKQTNMWDQLQRLDNTVREAEMKRIEYKNIVKQGLAECTALREQFGSKIENFIIEPHQTLLDFKTGILADQEAIKQARDLRKRQAEAERVAKEKTERLKRLEAEARQLRRELSHNKRDALMQEMQQKNEEYYKSRPKYLEYRTCPKCGERGVEDADDCPNAPFHHLIKNPPKQQNLFTKNRK